MLRTLLLLIIAFATFHSYAQNDKTPFTIKGRLLNADTATTITILNEEGVKIPLSADKSFEAKGDIGYNKVLGIISEQLSGLNIWAAEGEINLTLEQYYQPTDPTKKLLRIKEISGPAETMAYYKFWNRWQDLCKDYPHVPFPAKLDSVSNALYPEIRQYVMANPASTLAGHFPICFFLSDDHKKELIPLLDRKANATVIGLMEKSIRKNHLLRPGTIVPDWKQKTRNWGTFSLYSLKTNYILLTFWRSDKLMTRNWHRGYLKLYEEYHPKGFEIVSISVDDRKSQWEKAIKQDKFPWIQVSDLKGMNNKVASAFEYDFSSPFNILLDHNYRIIASDLTSHSLAAKLKELLPE